MKPWFLVVPFMLLLSSVQDAPAMQGLSVKAELCLSARPYGRARGFRNFLYQGRLTADVPPGNAYWIAAVEGEQTLWIQSASVRGVSGNVAFGVDNGSTYPLNYIVLHATTPEASQYLRRAQRTNTPLALDDLARTPAVSAFTRCQFELDDPEGVPDDHGQCACR